MLALCLMVSCAGSQIAEFPCSAEVSTGIVRDDIANLFKLAKLSHLLFSILIY